jgi:hypothetical protein
MSLRRRHQGRRSPPRASSWAFLSLTFRPSPTAPTTRLTRRIDQGGRVSAVDGNPASFVRVAIFGYSAVALLFSAGPPSGCPLLSPPKLNVPHQAS